MTDIKLVGCEYVVIKNVAKIAELEKVDANITGKVESSGFLQKNGDKYSIVIDQDKLKSDTKYAEAYKRFSDKYLKLFTVSNKDKCSVELEKNTRTIFLPATQVTKSTTREIYIRGGVSVTVTKGKIDLDEMGVKGVLASANIDLGGRFGISIPLTEDGKLSLDKTLEVKFAGHFESSVSAEDAFRNKAAQIKKSEEAAPVVVTPLPAATIQRQVLKSAATVPAINLNKEEIFLTGINGVKVVLGVDSVFIIGKDGEGIGINLSDNNTSSLYEFPKRMVNDDFSFEPAVTAWHVNDKNITLKGRSLNIKYIDVDNNVRDTSYHINIEVKGGSSPFSPNSPANEGLIIDFHGERTVEPPIKSNR